MIISYNVDNDLIKPIRKNVKSEEILAIENFLNSDNENVVFEYDDEIIAKRKRNNISVHIRKYQIPIRALLRGNKIVIVRKTK